MIFSVLFGASLILLRIALSLPAVTSLDAPLRRDDRCDVTTITMRRGRTGMLSRPGASEANVAHPGVGVLRAAGGGAVAETVGVGAQVRTPLDDLAGGLELGLVRIEAAGRVAPAWIVAGVAWSATAGGRR